jgi:tetratricopeptide (TPR) repeat protein
MSDKSPRQETLSERLNAFFSRYRLGLIVTASVLLIGIVAAVIVFQIADARAERMLEATEALQRLEADYAALAEEEESADLQATEEELRAAIADLIDEYPRDYGALRARFVLGGLEWQLENWNAAYEAFLAVAEEHRPNYLTATALFSAAAAAENMGDVDRARELYGRVADGDLTPNTERAHALFNLGRLAEADGDATLALEYYNRLVDDHTGSNWTSLGRNRIIWLTSQGTTAEG